MRERLGDFALAILLAAIIMGIQMVCEPHPAPTPARPVVAEWDPTQCVHAVRRISDSCFEVVCGASTFRIRYRVVGPWREPERSTPAR